MIKLQTLFRKIGLQNFIYFQLCLKSLVKGKSQGKSGVGRLLMKCTSCWSRNKISHRLKIETIRKRTSYTTMPIYLDDVNDGKFLGKITEGFDDGLVYETSEVNRMLHELALRGLLMIVLPQNKHLNE